jgi:hypothetical protein
VETVNDGSFREGECGPCEYGRYQSQPVLAGHLGRLIEIAGSVAGNWENGCLADAVNALARAAEEAKTALALAHGEAA